MALKCNSSGANKMNAALSRKAIAKYGDLLPSAQRRIKMKDKGHEAKPGKVQDKRCASALTKDYEESDK